PRPSSVETRGRDQGACPGSAVPAAHQRVSEVSLNTLGSLSLALQLQAQGGSGTENAGILRLIGQSPVAIAVLGTLLMLSVVTWSIFLFKWWTIRRADRDSRQFLDIFRRSNKFSE